MQSLKTFIQILWSRVRGSPECDASIQFELQRMTSHGGWENFYTDWEEIGAATTFDEPHDELSFSSESFWPPGKYRCVRRVDGRFDEVVWTIDSPNAAEFYHEQRAKERERRELESMSVEEIKAARDDDAFDALEYMEVHDVLSERRAEEREEKMVDSDDQSDLEQLKQDLLWEYYEQHEGDPGEAARDTLDLLMQSYDTNIEQCEYCDRQYGLDNCANCGKQVCREHHDFGSRLCSECHWN